MFKGHFDSNDSIRSESIKSFRHQLMSLAGSSRLLGSIRKMGEIEFSGRSHCAKFATMATNVSDNTLRNLIAEKWKLKPPTLIITVFGTEFEMASKVKKVFKRGLWKAAENAGCWLITDGLSRGITRLAGEAMRDYTEAYGGKRMFGFGVCRKSQIAHYDVIQNSQLFNSQPIPYKNIESISYQNQTLHFLDPNLSHFIIIDDDDNDDEDDETVGESIKSGTTTKESPLKQKMGQKKPGKTRKKPRTKDPRMTVEKSMTIWPITMLAEEEQTTLKETTNQKKASTDSQATSSSGLNSSNEKKQDYSRSSSSKETGHSKEDGSHKKKHNQFSYQSHTSSSGTFNSVPICGLLFGGDLKTLNEVANSIIFNRCPVVVIKGTGGAADMMSNIVTNIDELLSSSMTDEGESDVDERFKLILTEYLHDGMVNSSDDEIEEYIDLLKTIAVKHTGLVSVFDVAEEWDMDGYMISSLLSSANSTSKTELNLEQLDITLRLNRADIAKDKIFLEGKRWEKDSLNPFMYRALMNDRHEFVRLFIDQGFSLDDFMTVHILERLYTDQLTKINSKMDLFHQLYDGIRNNKVSLKEIGKMIRMLIGEFYQPLYLSKMFHNRLNPSKSYEKSQTMDAILKTSNFVANSGVKLAGHDNVAFDLPPLPKNDTPPTDSNKQTLDVKFLMNRRRSSLDFVLNPKLKRYLIDQDAKTKGILGTRYGKGGQEKDEAINDENVDEALKKSVKLERPARELMIWSVLIGKLAMTELFWTLEKEPVAAALLVSMLLHSLSKRTDDFTDKEDYNEEAKRFEMLAEGVLNECYREDEKRAQLIINRQLKFYGHSSVIRLAAQGRCIKFMAHPCCQDFLTNTWMGNLSNKNSYSIFSIALMFGVSLPFLIPKVIYYKYQEKEQHSLFSQNERPSPSQDRRNTLRRWSQSFMVSRNDSTTMEDVEDNSEFKKINLNKLLGLTIEFYTAPVTRFAYNMIFYAGFLCWYSYIMLVNFNIKFKPHDYLLIFWIVTLFVEEVNQIIKEGTFRIYISDGWNKLDCVAISFFLIGLTLRVITLEKYGGMENLTEKDDHFYALTDNVFVASRVFYSFSLFVFYVRLMYIFSFHIALGPKLVMIGKMVINDLIPFMIILGVILLGYSVSAHSIAYPNGYYVTPLKSQLRNSTESPTNFANNFVTTYYQMFGDFNLEGLRGEKDTCTKDLHCPHWLGRILVPIMMAIFVLMSNILLFNLLIAMFSRTYQEIESASTYYWNFQRYEMISEYIDRSPLAPPFIFFWYIYHIGLWIQRKILIVQKDVYEKSEDPFCRDYEEENPTKNKELINWEHMKANDYLRNTMEQVNGVVKRQGIPGASSMMKRNAIYSSSRSGANNSNGSNAVADVTESHRIDPNGLMGSFGQMLEFQLEKTYKEMSTQLTGQMANIMETNNAKVAQMMEEKQKENNELMEKLKRLEEKMNQEKVMFDKISNIETFLGQLEQKVGDKIDVMSVQKQGTSSNSIKTQTKNVATKDAKVSANPKQKDHSTNTFSKSSDRAVQYDAPVTQKSSTLESKQSTSEEQDDFFTAYKAKMLDIEDATALSQMIQITPALLKSNSDSSPDVESDPRVLPDLSLLSSSYKVRGYVSERNILGHKLWRLCPVNFEIYPGVRANVPHNLKDWNVPYPSYVPFQNSDEYLLYSSTDNYDPPDISINMLFNSYDRTYKVWRMSIGDRYSIDKETDKPLNPRGRTGLRDRGFLPRWGPNHAIFVLLTRSAKTKLNESNGGRMELEFGAIKSGDHLFIPFYFTDHLDSCFLDDCVVNVILALLYRKVRSSNNLKRTNDIINSVLGSSISVISESYVYDSLNADNAWVEGTIVNFHESAEFPFNNTLLEALVEDLSKEEYKWAKVARSSQIRQSHKTILRKLALSRQATF